MASCLCPSPAHSYYERGKKVVKVLGKNSPWFPFSEPGVLKDPRDKLVSSDFIQSVDVHTGEVFEEKYFFVNCGQCINCRLNQASAWATRCVLESQSYSDNWFVTLTYNDQHLPFDRSLHPEHFEQFIKNLRNYWYTHGAIDSDTSWHLPNHFHGIRFFGSGEYGDLYRRPHYHFILFNLPLPDNDLTLLGYNFQGDPLYRSKTLDKEIWVDDFNQPIGYVTVGKVNYLTAGYTARYTLKKLTGDKAVFYAESGLHPEFSRMSTHPGIAYDWWLDNYIKYYDGSGLKLNLPNGQTPPLPKYFDRLTKEHDPVAYDREAYRRQSAAILRQIQESAHTDATDEQKYLTLKQRAERMSNKLIRAFEKNIRENA